MRKNDRFPAPADTGNDLDQITVEKRPDLINIVIPDNHGGTSCSDTTILLKILHDVKQTFHSQ